MAFGKKKELEIGKILGTFDLALKQLEELELQEEGKEAEAMDEMTVAQAKLDAAVATKTKAATIGANFRALLASEKTA